MEDKKIPDKLIDKFIEFIYSKDNRKWIILFFILGLILRILISIKLPVNADEMVHGPHAIGFINSLKLQIMDEDAVWFWLTDLAVKIFGANLFGLRFLSVIFGAISIILIYLVAKEIFSERVAIFSALIFALSSYQLVETRAEMDIPMMFFVLFSIYFLLLYFKTQKNQFFFLTWIALGIAIMTKQIAAVFAPAFLIFFIFYYKRYHQKWEIKKILLAGLILILAILPILTFNYLLYKDKGILDLQFSRLTRISIGTYSSIIDTIQSFSINSLLIPKSGSLPGAIRGLLIFYHRELLIVLLLSIIGLFFLYQTKNKFAPLLTISFLAIFIFLGGTSVLSTHFVFGSTFISLLAGLGIVKVVDSFKEDQTKKYLLIFLLALIVLSLFIKIYSGEAPVFTGKNELQNMIQYKDQNIDKNSLIIADSRIYRGQIVFMFQDRYYLEGSIFPEVINNMDSFPGQQISVPTYFVECINTDCGWGTIQNQPALNNTMIAVANAFKDLNPPIATINDLNGQPYFRVYKKDLVFKTSIFQYVDSTHDWFYYPVNYQPKSKIFDSYSLHNLFDRLLDKFAYLLLLLECLIALISSILVFYFLYKKQ